MAAPRWFHWVGLVAVAIASLLLGAMCFMDGTGLIVFHGQEFVQRALGVLGLASLPLLMLRWRSGFRLAAAAILLEGSFFVGTIIAILYMFQDGRGPAPFQWFRLTIVMLVFIGLAAVAWRLQRAFVDR